LNGCAEQIQLFNDENDVKGIEADFGQEPDAQIHVKRIDTEPGTAQKALRYILAEAATRMAELAYGTEEASDRGRCCLLAATTLEKMPKQPEVNVSDQQANEKCLQNILKASRALLRTAAEGETELSGAYRKTLADLMHTTMEVAAHDKDGVAFRVWMPVARSCDSRDCNHQIISPDLIRVCGEEVATAERRKELWSEIARILWGEVANSTTVSGDVVVDEIIRALGSEAVGSSWKKHPQIIPSIVIGKDRDAKEEIRRHVQQHIDVYSSLNRVIASGMLGIVLKSPVIAEKMQKPVTIETIKAINAEAHHIAVRRNEILKLINREERLTSALGKGPLMDLYDLVGVSREDANRATKLADAVSKANQERAAKALEYLAGLSPEARREILTDKKDLFEAIISGVALDKFGWDGRQVKVSPLRKLTDIDDTRYIANGAFDISALGRDVRKGLVTEGMCKDLLAMHPIQLVEYSGERMDPMAYLERMRRRQTT
jgi:hypothetical protein